MAGCIFIFVISRRIPHAARRFSDVYSLLKRNDIPSSFLGAEVF